KISLPVHQIALVVNGVHLLENLKLDELAGKGVYEFAFIMEPLEIQGGTGSEGSPLPGRLFRGVARGSLYGPPLDGGCRVWRRRPRSGRRGGGPGHAPPREQEPDYCSIGAVSDARALGASRTPAAAIKTRTEPTMSAIVGRSPSISTEATMPTTGTLST